MCDIAVLIPCFNEEATIYKVVQDFASVFQSYDGSVRIYVYDNNSTDSTAEQAVRAGAVVRHEYRRGKGNVVRRMFREIEAECYIMVDGDDTYPADSAVEMADFVLNRQADMVIGDRLSASYFNENKRPFHNFGNILVRKSINALFHCEIKDIMTGYRAFSRGFVKSFPVLSEGFEIETEMSIHAIDKNMNIQHVVVSYRDRPDGSESKLNTYTDGLKVLFMIVKMFRNYRPQTFFCSIAFLFVLSANVFFWPVFIDFVHTGLVERFPTLIVCGFAAIASIQSFFAGLILENLREKDRRDFEMHLIQNRYDKTEMIGEKHKKKNMGGGYLMSEYRKPVNVKNDMGGGYGRLL